MKPLRTPSQQPGAGQRNFYEAVFALVCRIPRGRVCTYGAIAEACGTRMSARMVGWAMNASHGSPLRVPAHRVVNRLGMLTGKHHFATPTLMQELLEAEGVRVENDRVQEFERVFWDPAHPSEKPFVKDPECP